MPRKTHREGRAEQQAALARLASELRYHFAENEGCWNVSESPPDHNPAVTFTNGEPHFAFRVSFLWNKPDRLQVSGLQPKYNDDTVVSLDSGERRVEITVSAKRSAAAIAKDIERRLLPRYREQLAKLMERKKRYDDQSDKAVAFSQELARLSGGEVSVRNYSGRDQTAVHVRGVFTDILEIRYDGEGAYLRNVSLVADQARDFAKLIAQWNGCDTKGG